MSKPEMRSDRLREELAEMTRQRNVLRAALEKAYYELNTIHARDGVPYMAEGWKSSVTQEYFTSVVEECRAALKSTEAQ